MNYKKALLITLCTVTHIYASEKQNKQLTLQTVIDGVKETLKSTAPLALVTKLATETEELIRKINELTDRLDDIDEEMDRNTTILDNHATKLNDLQDGIATVSKLLKELITAASLEPIPQHSSDSSLIPSNAEDIISNKEFSTSSIQKDMNNTTSQEHKDSIEELQKQYIQMTQLKNSLIELINNLQDLPRNVEEERNNNVKQIQILIDQCNQIEKNCKDVRLLIDTNPLESQLTVLAKKHAVHLDSLGGSCMLCYLVWKLLEKPNKILPRISIETKQPIIEFCKKTSASAVFNAILNKLRGTDKNGWKCMTIFAGLEILTQYIHKHIEQHELYHTWIKKPVKNRNIIPYISWIMKSSIAHLFA